MSSPKPTPSDEVPETDATYERANADTTLKRGAARRDGKQSAPSKGDAFPPQEHQQPPLIRQQTQHRRQQQQQQSDSDRPGPLPSGGKIAGSMKTEEPDGWDQAPQDITDPRQKRHPRPDGVGGSDRDSVKRDPKR